VRIASTGPKCARVPSRTVDELARAFEATRFMTTSAWCCSPATVRHERRGWAFCSGGDQRIRGKDGYQYTPEDQDSIPRGWAAAHSGSAAADSLSAQGGDRPWCPAGGGRRALAARVCDMTIASREHAIFKQTDADVASFDSGLGRRCSRAGRSEARERDLLSSAAITPLIQAMAMAW